ncbi:hypothetical protein [Peribacillus asahii]
MIDLIILAIITVIAFAYQVSDSEVIKSALMIVLGTMMLTWLFMSMKKKY